MFRVSFFHGQSVQIEKSNALGRGHYCHSASAVFIGRSLTTIQSHKFTGSRNHKTLTMTNV